MATLESTAPLLESTAPLVEAPAPAGRRRAVEVAHLRKTYGSLVAVDDVSFTVAEGEIFGMQLQSGALPAKLRVGEILEEYRSFYRDPADMDDLLAATPGS